MPIVAGELDFHLSGGASNTDVNASYGGAKSTTEVDSVTTLNNLFADADTTESTAGSTKYRCIYLVNANTTLIARSSKVWINSNTPSSESTYEIGLGTSSINGTEQGPLADEDTAPSGVTFDTAVDEDNALSIGDIPATQHKAIWLKRVIDANAGVYNNDVATITFKCTSDNV